MSSAYFYRLKCFHILKWPPFSTQHFHMHFLEWKCLPLFETMVVGLRTHECATPPKWVKSSEHQSVGTCSSIAAVEIGWKECLLNWVRQLFQHPPMPENGFVKSLQWRHNGRDCVSIHQPHACLLNRLFRRRSKKTSKLRITSLCVGNSPGTGEFPAQMVSDAENTLMTSWWRHKGPITRKMFPFDDVIMVGSGGQNVMRHLVKFYSTCWETKFSLLNFKRILD